MNPDSFPSLNESFRGEIFPLETGRGEMMDGCSSIDQIKQKVFGAPLVDVIRRSPTGIPVVLKKCIEYLDSESVAPPAPAPRGETKASPWLFFILIIIEVLRQEGLFRKSGNHTQIQEMKQRIDKGTTHTYTNPPHQRFGRVSLDTTCP